MFKKFCIYSFLAAVFFMSAIICRTNESYSNGMQTELIAGDRIVVCVNPVTLQPATTNCIKLDYTIPPAKSGNVYAAISIIFN